MRKLLLILFLLPFLANSQTVTTVTQGSANQLIKSPGGYEVKYFRLTGLDSIPFNWRTQYPSTLWYNKASSLLMLYDSASGQSLKITNETILNNAINDVLGHVDSVGENGKKYTDSAITIALTSSFGGSVVPTSNPAPTLPTFYIAIQPGTYTNMGGFTVDSNSLAVISYSGSSWSISKTKIYLSDYLTKKDFGNNTLTINNNIPGATVYTNYPQGLINGTTGIVSSGTSADRWTGYVTIPSYVKAISTSGFANAKRIFYYDSAQVPIAPIPADTTSSSGLKRITTVPFNARYFAIYLHSSATIIEENYPQVFYGWTDQPVYTTKDRGDSLYAAVKNLQANYTVFNFNVHGATSYTAYPQGSINTTTGVVTAPGTNAARRWTGYISIPDGVDSVSFSGFTTPFRVFFYTAAQTPILPSPGLTSPAATYAVPSGAKYFANAVYADVAQVWANLFYGYKQKNFATQSDFLTLKKKTDTLILDVSNLKANTNAANFNVPGATVYTDYLQGSIADPSGVVTAPGSNAARRWSGYIAIPSGVDQLAFSGFTSNYNVYFYDSLYNTIDPKPGGKVTNAHVTVPAGAKYFAHYIYAGVEQSYPSLYYGWNIQGYYATGAEIRSLNTKVLPLSQNYISKNFNPENATSFTFYPQGSINGTTGVATVPGTNANRKFSGFVPVGDQKQIYFSGMPDTFRVLVFYYDSLFAPIGQGFRPINGKSTDVYTGAVYFAFNVYYQQAIEPDYANMFYGYRNQIYGSSFQTSSNKSDLNDDYELESVTGTIKLTPNSFTGTQRQRIQQALNFCSGTGGTVELGYDSLNSTSTWIVDKSLIIGSRTTLLIKSGSKLKAANRMFDNIIRNAGVIIDTTKPVTDAAVDIVSNYNIKIMGEGPTSIIEGPDTPYTAPRPYSTDTTPVTWTGDNYGWRVLSLNFSGITGLEVGNFSLQKTTGWGIQQSICKNIYAHDLVINSYNVANGDGVRISQYCKNVRVENITGATSDDMVFIGAIPNKNNIFPVGVNLFPNEVAGEKFKELGNPNVENVIVKNITGTSDFHMVTVYATGRGTVKNVSIDSVYQTSTSKTPVRLVLLNSAYSSIGAAPGDMTNIKINNVKSLNAAIGVLVNLPLRNSFINKVIKATGQTAVSFTTFPQDASVIVTNSP